MPRLRLLGLLAALAAAGSCSLVNAPADVIPGSGGATSSSTTSSVVTTSVTTTTASSSTGTGGATGCKTSADCPVSPAACRQSVCTAGVCGLSPLADGASCDDGLFCTVNDICKSEVCAGTPRVCPGQDPCNPGACQEAKQACAIVPGNDGSPCFDGNTCDSAGTCSAGVCTKGPDSCAPLATDCIAATCTAGGCVTQNKADGTSCGSPTCATGVCQAGHCNITPLNDGKACDDGLFCTVGDTCQSGFCVGTLNPCPSSGPCVLGTCNETAKACVMTTIANGMPCDDGNACTAGEVCVNQACTGGQPVKPVFSETFADNSKGWTLGPEWQIGKAKQSFGQSVGYPDPGADYTGEGGVAGVEIGGNAMVANPDPAHPSYYLTSPPVNTTTLTGSVYLTFHRWLNSDYSPYMTNTVEASKDGVTWAVVWQSGTVPINDGQWTFESVDITAYVSAATRFRFGFSIGDVNVYTVSSWNLDDVKVQNAPCPM